MAKDASRVRLRMPADDVLKMRGRSTKDAIRPPRTVGKDDGGLIVEWAYADCTVVLKRQGGCYRVAEVRDAG